MHAFANPARFLKIARPATAWLLGLGLVLVVAGHRRRAVRHARPTISRARPCASSTSTSPPPGSAWRGGGRSPPPSISQIVWRHPLAAVAGRAVAVPGATFAGLCLATGSIWGRPTWGTWWEWDGRLTSMLILFFLYLGYIGLAAAERERGGEGRMAALFGLVGAVNLPIIHYSVLWWRTLHQGQSISHRRRIVDRARIAVAAAADDDRLHRLVRGRRADADARRPGAHQARSAPAPERRRMNQWSFVVAAYARDRARDARAAGRELARDAPRRGRRRRGAPADDRPPQAPAPGARQPRARSRWSARCCWRCGG